MTLLLSLLINSFLVLIPISHAIDLTPALIWGGDSSSASNIVDMNPLGRISQLEFQKIIEDKIGSTLSPTLVFIKDKLCNEDFTQNPKDLNELMKTGNLQHFPAVDSPLTAFDKLSAYNQSMEEKPSSISDGQLIFTSATDLETVISIYNNLKESNPNLIAALIGRSCSYSKSERRKRAVGGDGDKNSTNAFIFPGNSKFISRVLLYAEKPLSFKNNDKLINLTMSNLESAKDSGNENSTNPLILTMAFNVEDKPTFKFEFKIHSPGYFTLKTIEYLKNGNAPGIFLKADSNIDIPSNFSYHCGPGAVFNNETHQVSLSFSNIQIEIDALKFSEAYDCVGFMSIPILSGIFVTLILALIMIWGISFIMDIRTMDRFDDPKGKTITISSQE